MKYLALTNFALSALNISCESYGCAALSFVVGLWIMLDELKQ